MNISLERKRSRHAYYFIAPYFIVFLLMQLYPIVYTFVMSFNFEQIRQAIPSSAPVGASWYIGGIVADPFGNFRDSFGHPGVLNSPEFWQSFVNTWVMWLINYIPQIVFALFLAVVLSRKDLKGKGVFRAIYYLPNLVTAVSISTLFSVLLDWQHGTLNLLLDNLGLMQRDAAGMVPMDFNYLGEPWYTKITVSFIQWWQWFGNTMIFVMAGMKSIPIELYEAAEVDGANKWQEFWKITLPGLQPTMLYIFITSLIGGMQMFDVPRSLTDGRGGPDGSITTMVFYLYLQGFSGQMVKNYAAAISYVLFLIILILSIFMVKTMTKRDE